MEGADVIGRDLSRITFKLGNVIGNLSWNSWATNIMIYRVINQLDKIREA